MKSDYEKPESFQKYKPKEIDAPKPKYEYETEKPYKPLELTTPNASYYLPDYKPVNPEIPVVHGLPSAPQKKVKFTSYQNRLILVIFSVYFKIS